MLQLLKLLLVFATLSKRSEGTPLANSQSSLSPYFLEERESSLDASSQEDKNIAIDPPHAAYSPLSLQRAEKVLESPEALQAFIQKLETAYVQVFRTRVVLDLIVALSSVALELGPNDGVKLSFTDTALESYEIIHNAQAPPRPEGFSPDTTYLLVTTFSSDAPASGAVWVVPTQSPTAAYELIRGLEQPTGVCFDVEHNYLYVTDSNSLYQYSIYWGERLLLANTVYTVIYEGASPSDCRVDRHGNLYFTVADANQLNMVSYLDLLFGFRNKQYTLYQGTAEVPLNGPTALELTQTNSVYLLNSGDELLLEASAHAEYVNGGFLQVVTHGQGGEGLAVADDGTRFFVQSNGTLWMQEVLHSPQIINDYTFQAPKKMCIADGTVYVADYSRGGVFTFDARDRTEPSLFVLLPTSYGVCCVEDSALYLSGLALILVSALF